jgi:leucyl aminopeptidase
MLASRLSQSASRRILQPSRCLSYAFLEESLRWRKRLSSETANSLLIPLPPNEWKDFIHKIESASTKEWFESQEGLVRVPKSLLPDIAEQLQLTPATESLVLLRQDQDSQVSEGGLLPPSKQWSALAKAKSADAHKVQVSDNTEETVTAFLSSCYSFDRYKTMVKESMPLMELCFPESETRQDTEALMGALYWAQDLISTPANDLTPGALQRSAEEWAASVADVEVETIVGNDLLSYNGALSTNHGCGMIHAVGRAASQEPDREPRLIQLRYRPHTTTTQSKPIALVGKGVTYDTGGLNLKPGGSMLNMKKDMGGAALALGLMRVLVERNFPKPIDCWIPAVENVLDATSYRPGDILTSVNGTTTEIGNTDAEGRLILADTLAMVSATKPDMILDFATLTGAQRVALGLEIPAVIGNQPELMPEIMEAARLERDPIWQLPLWEGYRDRMKSKIADYRNIPSDNGMGGAITAALYLSEFVDNEIPWIHVDFNGLDNGTGLGRAQSLRTMNRFLWDRYCGK